MCCLLFCVVLHVCLGFFFVFHAGMLVFYCVVGKYSPQAAYIIRLCHVTIVELSMVNDSIHVKL